jgi:hypothetical protein
MRYSYDLQFAKKVQQFKQKIQNANLYLLSFVLDTVEKVVEATPLYTTTSHKHMEPEQQNEYQ